MVWLRTLGSPPLEQPCVIVIGFSPPISFYLARLLRLRHTHPYCCVRDQSHPSTGDFYHLLGRGSHVFKTKALPTQRRDLNTIHLPEQATKSWLRLKCAVRQICAPSSLQEGLFCLKGMAFLGISATKCATIDYMSECASQKKTISPLFKTLIKLARRYKRLLCGQL